MTRFSTLSKVRLRSHWPQAGIGLGLTLNLLAVIARDSDLIGIGGNILTISLGVHLSRRRRRNSSDTER
jgi:hypothetical protein